MEKKLLSTQQIDNAKEKALEDCNTIDEHLEPVQQQINNLNNFHTDVFGEEGEEGEETEGGWKKDLEDQMAEQKKTYKALHEKINSLLPGATSVGLAKAFKDLKEEAAENTRKYTKNFYRALFFLSLASLFVTINKLSGWLLGIEFGNMNDPIIWIQTMLYKFLLLSPFLWLVLFVSKRRSEFQRLQQEYAHKEALAKSYHSFKEQIEALNEEDSMLMKKLIESAIAAISFNASTTLDGKHGDKTPVQEAAENITKKWIRQN